MILGGHLGGNTGLREMGTQGWPGFVSFGFVNNMQVLVSFQLFVNVEGLDENLLVHSRLWRSFTCSAQQLLF